MIKRFGVLAVTAVFALSGCAVQDEDLFVNNEVPVTENETVIHTDGTHLLDTNTSSIVFNNLSDKEVLFVSANTGSSVISADNTSSFRSVKNTTDNNSAADETDLHMETLSIDDTSARAITTSAGLKKDYSNIRTGSSDYLWVDNNAELTSYVQKKATVRYEGIHCYIWTIDDDPILDNVAMIRFAAMFDLYYSAMHNIFGNESENLYIGSTKVPMTNNKVNIVIYNITKPTYVGYFFSKDYFAGSSSGYKKFSNEGKFFYINYRYASGTESQKRMAVTTLIHEFQHMINYSVKNLNGITSADWYNEMLSMLAEDMLSTLLLSAERAPSVLRMNSFKSNYYKVGLTTWEGGASYGMDYAFGAWLVRNFGGVKLVKEMMSNRKANEESVVAAVNRLNETDYSFTDLFNKFVTDCAEGKNFNKASVETDNGFIYAFPAISGRIVNNAPEAVNLQPFGFAVRSIEVTEDTATFTLSKSLSFFENLFVIVK